ncbi:DNA repair protein RecO [Teichococcus vastitatis]|uniref:DNA repair protein RecO n=1 Tax=Teichococcus vastitatis TaxID=2307076 RepID=A0ABS9W1Q4_9PROT|nr:DNA repair protein RecO [Pseudoroseomonas vastitatis]MCI0753116.1 DNA repair protein RecO [Pseudoroseomonas vastitatis]
MEWQAPAIVLEARPHGEGGAVIAVLTEDHGRHLGLAKGGASRSQAGLWQPGNLVEVRWIGRLAEQLGHFTGEMVHPSAALAMDDPLSLALLQSACALAADALPEREAQPRVFSGLLTLMANLGRGAGAMLADYIRWEALLLEALGYGLDLSSCAVTGMAGHLTHVSPRTGRAVSAEAAEPFRDRLLPLPLFLLGGQDERDPAEWLKGLRLTGHFLARDAFGARHRPMPPARERLQERLAALVPPPPSPTPAA